MAPISNRLPPKLTVEFWMTSSARLAGAFKIGMSEVTFCSIRTVSHQISLHSPFVLIYHSLHFWPLLHLSFRLSLSSTMESNDLIALQDPGTQTWSTVEIEV